MQRDTDALKKMIDINNSIDVALFFNLIQAKDNINQSIGTKNIYLSVKMSPEGEGCLLYTPWDLDNTWGKSVGVPTSYYYDRIGGVDTIIYAILG